MPMNRRFVSTTEIACRLSLSPSLRSSPVISAAASPRSILFPNFSEFLNFSRGLVKSYPDQLVKDDSIEESSYAVWY